VPNRVNAQLFGPFPVRPRRRLFSRPDGGSRGCPRKRRQGRPAHPTLLSQLTLPGRTFTAVSTAASLVRLGEPSPVARPLVGSSSSNRTNASPVTLQAGCLDQQADRAARDLRSRIHALDPRSQTFSTSNAPGSTGTSIASSSRGRCSPKGKGGSSAPLIAPQNPWERCPKNRLQTCAKRFFPTFI
jgi:hypothetical protein